MPPPLPVVAVLLETDRPVALIRPPLPSSMPPPLTFATFWDRASPSFMTRVPTLKRPPPSLAVLEARLLALIVSVPPLSMPPPRESGRVAGDHGAVERHRGDVLDGAAVGAGDVAGEHGGVDRQGGEVVDARRRRSRPRCSVILPPWRLMVPSPKTAPPSWRATLLVKSVSVMRRRAGADVEAAAGPGRRSP